MKTATYPALGSRVDYVRQNPADFAIVKGSGIVKAISLDLNNRVSVNLSAPIVVEGEPGEEHFTVALACLNPSDEFIAQLEAGSSEIKRLTDEGNGKVREIVTEYNKYCDDQLAAVLGDPVEFDE